jgi:SAM-dependent methyltransferase
VSQGSYSRVRPDAAEGEADRLRRQAHAVWTREYAALQSLGLEVGMRILDVGCGAGASLGLIISSAQPRIAVGIDLDRENLKHARRAAPVACADAVRLPFDQAQFDFVLLRLILRHVHDPARLITEAARVVRSGGRVCAVDTDDGALLLDPEPEGWPQLWTALDRSARGRGGNPTVGRRLRRLLLEAGLTDARTAALSITSDDVPPPAFVNVFLAPSARPVDPEWMAPAEVERAWSSVRAWAQRADAFACINAILASAQKEA